jgi:aerobic-type carbon monoxide dehydrogenase small subunit (CoxS/CutS family)
MSEPESFSVRVNGKQVSVRAGATVAVAVLAASATCRTSVTGQPRSPLCGMGTCFECRVAINGEPQRRSCQVLCEANMEIEANG